MPRFRFLFAIPVFMAEFGSFMAVFRIVSMVFLGVMRFSRSSVLILSLTFSFNLYGLTCSRFERRRSKNVASVLSLDVFIVISTLLVLSLDTMPKLEALWLFRHLASAWVLLGFGYPIAKALFLEPLNGYRCINNGSSFSRLKLSSIVQAVAVCSFALMFGHFVLLPIFGLLPEYYAGVTSVPVPYFDLALLSMFVSIVVVVVDLLQSTLLLIDANLFVPIVAIISSIWFDFSFSTLIFYVPLVFHEFHGHFVVGLILVSLMTTGSIAARKIDVPGGIVGFFIALAIFCGEGYRGFLMLLLFFVCGSGASSYKFAQKEKLGLQQKGNIRGVEHALANGFIPAFLSLSDALIHPSSSLGSSNSILFSASMAAALSSAMADTLSSELGNVLGTKYLNILTFKEDIRGKDGVISFEGTFCGFVGSFFMALIFYVGNPKCSLFTFLAVMIAGNLGNVVDSFLGATLQRMGYLTNSSVNLLNTLAAAVFMLFVGLL